MRFIAELKDEEMLPQMYDIVDDIIKFMDATKIAEIRKTLPPEGISRDEQGKKNIKEMFRIICKEYPSETAVILRKLWVLDKGENEEDIPNFFVSLSRLLSEGWMIDFFISAVNLVK